MRILVTDDSPITRKIIRNELTSGGFEIFEASNGAETLEAITTLKPDLITLDANMPGMDGFEVCRKIRANEAGSGASSVLQDPLPVIFITADDTIEGREMGFEVGATNFITKPFQAGQLLEVVNNILRPSQIWLGVTALVVEDSGITRNIVVNALKRLGIEVLEAGDGASGLEMVKSNYRKIDMVISDYRMPGMDGDQLCREIRKEKEYSDIPVIIMSAKGEKSAILSLFQAGATDYLIKPFSIEELMARVGVHLNSCLLTRELKNKNREMEEDLELARNVQKATIHDNVNVNHLRKVVYYKPHGLVSGDIYDFSVNDKNELCAFLGDATGHGVGAAFLTMMVQVGLDSIGKDAPVEDVLTHIHRLIVDRCGDRFVTAIYAKVSPEGLLTFSSAGHPPLLVILKNGGTNIFSESGGMPLGMMEDPLPFDVETFQLSPGDKFFMYTDGLLEWANSEGKLYGRDRFVQFLTDHRRESLKANIDELLADVRKFADGNVCDDDITIIGFQYEKPWGAGISG